MKRSIPFILKTIGLSAFLLLASFNAIAQYSFSAERESLRQAIGRLQRSSGYSFFFSDELPGLDSDISVSLSDAPLKSILDAMLSGSETGYRIEEADKQVVLFRKENPQDNPVITVSGVVRDSSGAPMGGVTVFSDDGGRTAVTDREGRYSIRAMPGAALSFRFLGFGTQTVRVYQSRTLDVTMTEEQQILDDIVVIGYGQVRRGDITTAVSIVPTRDIDERPLTSASAMIQGRAAGVLVVTPDGSPGAGLSIRVRGSTSLEASNSPLFVVDGITMDDIANLSVNDIESMQILKDASSAAIYGARAANGVIVITTKHGAAGKPVVSLNVYAGFSNIAKKIDALDTGQYKELMAEMAAIGGTTVAPVIPADEERYTDWHKLLFGTGVQQNYQLSLRSGTEKLQYYVSAGYMKDKGVVAKAGFQRINFRANVDSQHTRWLKMNLNVSYSNTERTAVTQNASSMRAGSIMSAVNTPPFFEIWDNRAGHEGQYAEENNYGIRFLHPLAANDPDDVSKTDRFTGTFGLTVTPVADLDIKSGFSLDLSNNRWSYYMNPWRTSDGRGTNGNIQKLMNRDMQWQWDNTVNYARTFGENHHLSAMAGAIMTHAQADGMWASGTDLPTEPQYWNIHSLNVANQIKDSDVSSDASAWSLASFIARVMYDYQRKYLLTVNFRADGSSRFQRGSQWGYFPSFSAGWRISGEEFMKDAARVVSDLKIRFGWGSNGNQGGIGNYAYLQSYSTGHVTPSDGAAYPGLSRAQISVHNPGLTWETTSQWNVGIDAAFFDSRIMFTADAYYKKTRNMIVNTTFPESVALPGGYTSNDGEMVNKGLEFALATRNFVGRFKWNTDFNISLNRNRVTKMGMTPIRYYAYTYNPSQPAIRLEQGWQLGTFYGYVSEGVDPETGMIVYKDLDGNGEITPGDRTVIGYAQPKFIFGMTNEFSYKGFTLSLFLQGSYGNDIYNMTRRETEGMIDFRNQSTEVLRRWKRPGMITDIPRAGNFPENLWNSSRFVEDGSYLRVKTLTLSYDFKPQWLKKLKISRLQPYFTAENLLTFTKYSGYDPEVNANGNSSTSLGVDFGTYPQVRKFIFGVNMEF